MGRVNARSTSWQMFVGHCSATWRTASFLLTADHQTWHCKQEQIQPGTQPLQPGHNSLGKAELHHLGLARTLPWGHLHSSDVQPRSADTRTHARSKNRLYILGMWFGFSLLTANGDQPSKFCPKAGMLPRKPPRQCVSMHVIPRNRVTGLKINLVEQALIMHLRLYELWALQPYSWIGIWLLQQRKWCPGVTCNEALPG